MSDSINVRVTLDSYDIVHPSEKQTQVYVQIPGVGSASWLLDASFYAALKNEPWPHVVDSAHEEYERRGVVSDSASAAGRKAVVDWLLLSEGAAYDAHFDTMQAAWEADQARRHPVARKLLKENEELRSQLVELERLRKRVADQADQHDDLAHALGRGIGTEWGDLISIAAGLVKAEEDARTLRSRVAELEAAAYGDAEVRLLAPVEQIQHLHQAVAAQMARADTLDRLCREQRARADAAEARERAEEKLRPHRQMIATSNLHYIGKLELRIRRTRTLHLNHPDAERCQHDGQAWPCPTVAALEAAVGEAVHPCGCPKRFGRHAVGCPTEAAREAEAGGGDTLPAWLYQRFMPDGTGWDYLDSGDREYWEHQARAVRRAVERGGFKSVGPSVEESADALTRLLAPTQALREDDPNGLHHTYRMGRDLPETGGAR